MESQTVEAKLWIPSGVVDVWTEDFVYLTSRVFGSRRIVESYSNGTHEIYKKGTPEFEAVCLERPLRSMLVGD